jgi:hypothetical protein
MLRSQKEFAMNIREAKAAQAAAIGGLIIDTVCSEYTRIMPRDFMESIKEVFRCRLDWKR